MELEYNQKILEEISKLDVKFKVIEPVKNCMNGIETESVLLEYEGDLFLYVPGRLGVTLGWDAETCPLGENVLKAMKEYYKEGCEYIEEETAYSKENYLSDIEEARKGGDLEKVKELELEMEDELEGLRENYHDSFEEFMEEWKNHLKECMSPLRTVDIPSMIVEVNSRYLEKPTTKETFLTDLSDPLFSLPTEDEWEYLCNGGARSLLRWGDSLEEEMNEMFETGSLNSKGPKLLIRPNMFGLLISYNSYKIELIDNPDYTKGGDGGCSLCGGDGLIYVLPAYTAFYREKLRDSSLSENYYSYRRILRLN